MSTFATEEGSTATRKVYEQDGEEAREIAKVIPYFPFKGIPRFYDIGGFLSKPGNCIAFHHVYIRVPMIVSVLFIYASNTQVTMFTSVNLIHTMAAEVFRRIVDIFAERYAGIGIDAVAGMDARGFVLGPPIALALNKPFIMIRKKGKMPNCIESRTYQTEYGPRAGMCLQRDAVKKGDRVLVIDDLVATGGTLSAGELQLDELTLLSSLPSPSTPHLPLFLTSLSLSMSVGICMYASVAVCPCFSPYFSLCMHAGIEVVQMLGGVVVECACVVELKMFINPSDESGMPNRTKLFTSLGFGDVPVWALISEEILDVEAALPAEYKDDGEEH
jgi:adenine phosphoribosyltransferase